MKFDETLEHAHRQLFTKKLAEHVKKLPERECLILALYYQEELTLKQIGDILDLTESRVCQIHAQAMLRLQARLPEEFGLI